MKFSIQDFLSFLRIWSHLLNKSLMEKLHFLCSDSGSDSDDDDDDDDDDDADDDELFL